MQRILPAVVCALCACGAQACGGSGGGGGPSTLVLYSQAPLDGFITEGEVLGIVVGIHVGDEDNPTNGTNARGFMSFRLAALPAGATISSAVLRCYQVSVEGSPYLKLGDIIASHVDYGDSLDVADFDSGEIALLGTLSTDAASGWKTLDVTGALSYAVTTGLPRCQFRLRSFADTPGDHLPDFARFEDGDNYLSSGNRPQLVITYTN